MTPEEAACLQSMLSQWRWLFPQSGNLAEAIFGIPSSIVRFDYAVGRNGMPTVYEVEDRPAGFGVTGLLNEEFLPCLLPYLREQEKAVGAPWAIYVSKERDGTSDDGIFADAANIPIFRGEVDEACLQTYAWYVRASRHESEVASFFTQRSLSTIEHEGHKHYGVGLGLWVVIDSSYEPDFTIPFAVKPSSGSRFEEVLLFHPDRHQGSGFATKTKVLEAIRSGRVQYLQPYHPPEQHTFLTETHRLIRRAYFVWSPSKRQYVSLGGLWMATPTARVHGTSAAVSGVLQAA